MRVKNLEKFEFIYQELGLIKKPPRNTQNETVISLIENARVSKGTFRFISDSRNKFRESYMFEDYKYCAKKRVCRKFTSVQSKKDVLCRYK